MILYVIGGLIAAFLMASAIAGCEHRQKEKAYAEREALQARFDGFVIEAKRIGEEEEKRSKEKEASDHAIHDQTVALLKSDLASRDAAIERLRNSPITRPDRSPVPVVACSPKGVDGAAAELVSVVEYRELQARAYDDALRFSRLQEWIKATGHPIE